MSLCLPIFKILTRALLVITYITPNLYTCMKCISMIVKLALISNDNYTIYFQLFVTMKRKLGIIWIPIPCDEKLKIGSCHYSDACDLSPFKDSSSCPSIFQDLHVPCKCPVFQVRSSFLKLFFKL